MTTEEIISKIKEIAHSHPGCDVFELALLILDEFNGKIPNEQILFAITDALNRGIVKADDPVRKTDD